MGDVLSGALLEQSAAVGPRPARALDEAVAAADGWPADIPNDDALG